MADPLLEVAQTWLNSGNARGLAAGASAMTQGYKTGRNSTESAVDIRSYLAVRLPATYAACARVLKEVVANLPHVAPRSVLDIGAGPGTASWAAVEAWPGMERCTLVDCHEGFAKLAKTLQAEARHPAIIHATAVHADVTREELSERADLVICAYALAEIPLAQVAQLVNKAWRASQQVLVLVEPGTPAGFSRIRAARDALLLDGATVVAPCPHHEPCPLKDPHWCHFAVRLARSRLHMQAKQAKLPFEDEKFCYLVATREPQRFAAARILKSPVVRKGEVELIVCDSGAIASRNVARRNAAGYKRAKKLEWGDALTAKDKEQLWPEN